MRRNKSQITIIAIIITISIIACTKNIKNNNPNNQAQNDNSAIDNSNLIEFEKKYLREGFLNSSMYRVVIVSEKDSTDDQDSIKKRAEKRAFVSLQKYLRSENRLVDKNCLAKLLDMINTDGIFTKRNFKNYSNTVYYLDIKRRHLKKHLYSISER